MNYPTKKKQKKLKSTKMWKDDDTDNFFIAIANQDAFLISS